MVVADTDDIVMADSYSFIERSDIPDVLRHIIRRCPAAIVVTDARSEDNPIVFANGAFERLTGYGDAEVLGRNCRLLQGPHPESEPRRRLADAIREGRPIRIRLRNFRKSGELFWNELFVSPVRNADGQIFYYFGVLADVTQQVALQQRTEELRNQLAMLRAQAHHREVLFGELRHRIKNHLQMLAGGISHAERRCGDDPSGAIIRELNRRLQAIASLYHLLDPTSVSQDIDLAAYLTQACQEIVDASVSRVRLGFHFAEEVSLIAADLALPIALFAQEAVTNAIKHAFPDDRSGTIRIVLMSLDSTTRYLSIRDDGIGVPGAILTDKHRRGGLALLQRLAEQVDGQLAIDGSNGTTVHLEFESVGQVRRVSRDL